MPGGIKNRTRTGSIWLDENDRMGALAEVVTAVTDVDPDELRRGVSLRTAGTPRGVRGEAPSESGRAAIDDLGAASRFSDPMTDDRLRYRRDAFGYVVYSIGGDGLDNGGDLGALNPHGVGWWITPTDAPDWGIRIRLPEPEAP